MHVPSRLGHITSPVAFLAREVPGWASGRGKHLQGLTLQAALPFLLLPRSQTSVTSPLAVHPSM